MKIDVIGIHALDPDDYESMETSPWFLVEVLVTDVDGWFEFLFEQPDPDLPPERWLVGYLPMLLDPAGTKSMNVGAVDLDTAIDLFPPEFRHVWQGTMRCAFFLFGYRSHLELQGPTGPLVTPPLSPLPERLKAVAQNFVEY